MYSFLKNQPFYMFQIVHNEILGKIRRHHYTITSDLKMWGFWLFSSLKVLKQFWWSEVSYSDYCITCFYSSNWVITWEERKQKERAEAQNLSTLVCLQSQKPLKQIIIIHSFTTGKTEMVNLLHKQSLISISNVYLAKIL